MKYDTKIYEGFEFYAPDECEVNHTQRIVKTRKEHVCCSCFQTIPSGENALMEKAFVDGKPETAYTCIGCCDREIQAVREACGEEDESND